MGRLHEVNRRRVAYGRQPFGARLDVPDDVAQFGQPAGELPCFRVARGADHPPVAHQAPEAVKVGREVDGMAVSGIAHTGKRVPHQERTREVIGVWSSLVPRERIQPCITFTES